MLYARQSTAIIVTVGPVLDADGVAVTTAVVGNFKLSKNGGAPAALDASATLTHRHTGKYSLSLTATDVNTVGSAEVTIDATTNECPLKELQVIEPAVYDALFADTAAGYQVPIWSSAGATVNLSATTIATLTNLPAITANWLTASGLATDAVEEIRNAITGGAYDLDTDANGRIRIVDGVGAGEINTNAGAIALVDLVTTLTTYTGNTPQTGDSYAIVNSGTHGNAALKTLIDTIDNFVDTEITDIQARLPAALTAGGNIKADALAVSGDTTAADNLESAYDGTGYTGAGGIVRASTAQAGGGVDTIVLDAGASASNDVYNGCVIRLLAGTGAGEIRIITDYNGTTKVATIDRAWTAPDATTTFEIRVAQASALTDAILAQVGYVGTGAISSTSFGNDSITAAALAADAGTEIGTAVWASAIRTLTAIDEDSTTLDLDATIRAAVGLASANLDTQLDTLPTAAEIQIAITGGAYDLDTDANGRIRIVDGTGTGELDTALGLVKISGTIQTLDSLNTAQIVEHDATQAAIAALNNISTAQVNAEVVDALNVDTYAEPGQGAPGATISLAAKLNWLYTSWRNKKDNNGTVTNLYADNGTTVVSKQNTSESGGTVTKAEWITGA